MQLSSGVGISCDDVITEKTVKIILSPSGALQQKLQGWGR